MIKQELSKIIKGGIARGLIKINEDYSVITYINEGKSKNYNNPEEKVQAETFCRLVLDYNYPVEYIKQFVAITVGSGTKFADIIVYNDRHHQSPHIIVECKKAEITEQEFIQATNQAFSYAHATAGTLKFVWTTSGIKNACHKFDKESSVKESISTIPKFGVTKISPYTYAFNGGPTKEGHSAFPLEKVEESKLTNVFKQAHQALWGGGELNPSEAFDELDKLIFCKIYDEKIDRQDGEPYEFQVITIEPANKSPEAKEKAENETNQQLLKRLHKLYEEGRKIGERKNDPEIFKDDIKLSATKARTVVSYLEGIDLLGTDLDSKGRAFETFMGSFFRGDFGQYFTPRKIVSFIVESLPITNKSKVLDTSCGSGGFLLHALDKVRKEAWNFYNYTPNSGAEESQRCHTRWHTFAEHNLFGIEINEQIARTAKMNMIIHDDGQTNVVSSDGLISPEALRVKTGNQGFEAGSFDFIITNPPFGSTIKQTEKAYLHQYKLATRDVEWLNPTDWGTLEKLATSGIDLLDISERAKRPSQSSEVLFIEQAAKYLRADGYLAVVIPDGILTNSSMQMIRDYISETFRIVAVVSLPQTAFAANGAGVKSSVLFLKKYQQKIELDRIRLKYSIQKQLIFKSDDGKELEQLITDKKIAITKINKLIKLAEKAENIEKADHLKLQKQDLTDEFNEKIENVKELLTEKYNEEHKEKLLNYPIFMAIAENIGYDASGKETDINELEDISKELARFIEAIENGEDSFFL